MSLGEHFFISWITDPPTVFFLLLEKNKNANFQILLFLPTLKNECNEEKKVKQLQPLKNMNKISIIS